MRALRRIKIGIIGAGHMGQALIRGLVAAGLPRRQLLMVEANPATRRRVAHRYHVQQAVIERIAARCRVVIIAVKPQDVQPVLGELTRGLVNRGRRQPVVISIAAGVPIRALERRLGPCPVVRVMPNLAATVGASMSALAPGQWATSIHRQIAIAIFRCVGDVVELPERLFDAVTAISGSGPAYFFLMFKALRDAGIRQRLPPRLAQRLAVQTALGSAKLVYGSPDPLETWIARVASKKGTTEAALTILAQRRWGEVLEAGVRAAAKRSRELSASLR